MSFVSEIIYQPALPTLEPDEDPMAVEQARSALLDMAMQDPLCALNLYFADELDMVRILMDEHGDRWTLLTVAHGSPWNSASTIQVTSREFETLYSRYHEEYGRVGAYLDQNVSDIER